MEKETKKIHIGTDQGFIDVTYPKYLYPKFKEIHTKLKEKTVFYLHSYIKTYVLVKSKTGNNFYIPIIIRHKSKLKNEMDGVRSSEFARQIMYDEVFKFIHFNNYHEKTNEEIKEILKN